MQCQGSDAAVSSSDRDLFQIGNSYCVNWDVLYALIHLCCECSQYTHGNTATLAAKKTAAAKAEKEARR